MAIDPCDARRQLQGFEPQWTIRRGAKELYETYKRARLTVADFEGPRYQRIARVKALLAEGALDENLRFAEQAMAAT